MEESSPVEIVIEDSVKYESCLKRDVCIALRSIAKQYIEFQHGLDSITQEFEIKTDINFKVSILDCKHYVNESLSVIRG